MNFTSIKDISSTTGIPETTIRRYLKTFDDILPQGNKMGRAWKYPGEMLQAVKTIHGSYQDGLSVVEIRGKLSGETLPQPKSHDTTTTPPQTDRSFQEDIKDLTKAIKTLTDVITSLPPQRHHSTTRESSPDHVQVCDSLITTTTPPQDHTAPGEPDPWPTGVDLVTTSPPDDHQTIEELDSVESPFSIPDCRRRKLTIPERDAILINVAELYPGRKNAQKRADVLNDAGLKCGKGTKRAKWTAKKFSDNLRHAKGRQAAK